MLTQGLLEARCLSNNLIVVRPFFFWQGPNTFKISSILLFNDVYYSYLFLLYFVPFVPFMPFDDFY